MYVSKRREQEDLLTKAERTLDAISRKARDLPTPPQSPSDQRISPFDDSTKPSEGIQSGRRIGFIKSVETTDVEPQRPLKIVKENVVTSGLVDELKDDIPEGLEMPGTIEDVLIEPSAEITMEAICTAFDYLKVQIKLHCRSFYSFEQPIDADAVPSFTYLKRNHPELFRYIRYLADGSQYGWDQLLTIGPQRENLVYAIISRAIMTHVFDAELFGASSEHEEALLEMCREYLNFDAFVRNTHRAEIIAPILLSTVEKHANGGTDPYSYFSAAIDSLGRRINIMLAPLQHPNKDDCCCSTHPEESMRSILQAALKIHLAVRLAGANGTVYRFESIHKLARWDHETMNCVNQLKMDATCHHGEEALVKICCFPAIFATVPSGPNLEKFADPAFVEEWKQTFAAEIEDDDAVPGEEKKKKRGGKAIQEIKEIDVKHKNNPLITTYPIALADVVLENTPTTTFDRASFPTLSQTMAREQAAMSDATLLSLTGIHRPRKPRNNKIVKHARKTAAKTAVVLLAAATAWYLNSHCDEIVASHGLGGAVAGAGSTMSNLLQQILTPEVGPQTAKKSTEFSTFPWTLSSSRSSVTEVVRVATLVERTAEQAAAAANTTPA